MPHARILGKEAEDRAARYLVEKGYTIVTRRYKARHGEIDLIALDGEILVFVEVKMRGKGGFLPESAIDERKLGHLMVAAEAYVESVGCEGSPLRYDMIALQENEIRHYVGVFSG